MHIYIYIYIWRACGRNRHRAYLGSGTEGHCTGLVLQVSSELQTSCGKSCPNFCMCSLSFVTESVICICNCIGFASFHDHLFHDFGEFWGPFRPGTLLQAPLGPEVGALRAGQIFDCWRLLQRSWGRAGPLWSSFSKKFDTKVESLFIFASDPSWRGSRSSLGPKSKVCGRAWMLLKHCEYCQDFIFACFLADALPRTAPDFNFAGFEWIWYTFSDPLDFHLGPGSNFLAMFVLSNFC